MLEITTKQLLSFDNVNRARALRDIAAGLVKYIPEKVTNEENYNHIPRID